MKMKRLFEWARKGLSRRKGPQLSFQEIFSIFQNILALNNHTLDLIAGANDKLSGDYVFDKRYIDTSCDEVLKNVMQLVLELDRMAPGRYPELMEAFERIQDEIQRILSGHLVSPTEELVLPYKDITRELAEAVGGKNCNLAEIGNILGMRVPPGFAVTTAAFELFMASGGLGERVDKCLQEWKKGELSLSSASSKISSLIMDSALPRELSREIQLASDALLEGRPRLPRLFAVRSSAIGEDGEFSFAGQYRSLLGVKPGDLPHAYKTVVASLYSERAMEYRRSMGVLDTEVAMAVGCQMIFPPRSSGVLYTYDPVNPRSETMVVSATWGLGEPVVSGRVEGDSFTLSRRRPFEIEAMHITRKDRKMVLDAAGGSLLSRVDPEDQTRPCLDNVELHQLVEAGLKLEKFFKKPQDVEFCVSEEGEIVVLQARPLALREKAAPRAEDLAKVLEDCPVLVKGEGVVAQEGVATGEIFLLTSDEDLDRVPPGSILVVKYASPRLAKAIKNTSGIIAEVGSPTGHLATIAREFRVPTLMNFSEALSLFHEGQEVTLDTEERTVYDGIVRELQLYQMAEEDIEETYEYRLLRRVLKKIEPLNLLDPTDKDFTPGACKTLHDITRFVHEKAVEALIDYSYYHPRDKSASAMRLKWDIPLDLVVIDIGGGVAQPGPGKEITPDAVTSYPMKALLEGMAHPGAWSNTPMSVDAGSFMSSLTRTFSAELMNPEHVGQNLAILSGEYVNLHLRLGYHFTLVDAYVVDNINDNYAYFRFFGGVTDIMRRTRRVRFLAEVLTSNDFRIELHDDLVVGRVKKIDREGMYRRLYLIGILIGFSRQLDVRMVSDRHIDMFMEQLSEMMEERHG